MPLSLRSVIRALRLPACVLTVTLAAGCGDSCLTLASQICKCLPDDGSRAACNQRAKESEANFPVRSQDQAFCQHQLDSHACDCNVLNTPEGKVGCGIAFAPSSRPVPAASR